MTHMPRTRTIDVFQKQFSDIILIVKIVQRSLFVYPVSFKKKKKTNFLVFTERKLIKS